MSRRKDWLSFEEARDIIMVDIKKYNINSEKKWHNEYIAQGKKPKNIPSHPQTIYWQRGWISWGHWLRTNNIRGTLRKYKVNDNYFKKWSHDMAYILGFWWADGYIRCRENRHFFSLCQNSKDKYLLQNILDRMNSNNPICCPKTRESMSHFEISSKIIFDDIIKLQGKPNKSLDICFPTVPKKYLADFVRGYFDGDGCISRSKRSKSYSCYFASGSEVFIKKLGEVLKREGCIQGKINYTKTCYRLRLNVLDTKKLGNFMYHDFESSDKMLKLDRKYDKFVKNGGK